MQRMRPVALLATALALLVALTACTAVHTLVVRVPPGHPPQTLVPSPVASSTPAPSPHPSWTPSPRATPDTAARATGPGCARTGATTPTGAISARVGDLDGDGRADIEWAELRMGGTLHFGVTTASGATVGAQQEFAGGGDRSLVVGRLANGAVAVITSEGRGSALWSFAGCALHQVKGRYDKAESVDHTQLWFYTEDDGGAAGCFDGHLEGYHLRRAQPGAGEVTITATAVMLSADGLHARTGAVRTVVRNAPDASMSDYDRLRVYSTISCGASPVLRPVVHSAG